MATATEAPPVDETQTGIAPEDDPMAEVEPDNEPWADEPADRYNLAIEGSDGQLGWDVGGKAPVLSEFALTGGKIEVDGQFDKGELVTIEITARVGEIHFVDKVDNTGHVVTCTRRHKARVEGVRLLTQE